MVFFLSLFSANFNDSVIIEPAERESRRAPWGKHARNRRAEDSWRKGEGAEAEMETKDAHI